MPLATSSGWAEGAPVLGEVGEGAQLEEGGGVVVDLPADPAGRQRFGHGLPAERSVVLRPVAVGLHDGPAGDAGRVDGGGDRHDPVRVGRTEHRAVVPVTDGEGVGQGVVEGQIVAREVTHGDEAVVRTVVGGGDVGRDEGVHGPVVPALVLGAPGVGDVVGRLAVLGRRVAHRVERLEEPGGIDADAGRVAELVEDRVPLAVHTSA